MKTCTSSQKWYLMGVLFTTIAVLLVESTDLYQMFPTNPNKLIKAIALLCFVASIHTSKWRIRRLVFSVFFLISVFIATLICDRDKLLLCAMSVALCIDIDFRAMCKFLFKCNILILVVVFSLCLMGILENHAYPHFSKTAYSLGFQYYSTVSFCVFFLTVIAFYLYGGHRKTSRRLLFYIFSLIVNGIIYLVTTVRLTFILLVFFIGLIILYDELNFWRFKKFNSIISVIMFPMMFLASVLLPLYYNKNSMLISLDEVLNHRLSLSRIALQRYEISLFGNLIKALESDTYFYLDSGYLYLLLGYGLVVFLVIMSAYMIVFRYALKSNDKKLFIWCIIVSVFSFVNNIIVDVNINPLLFGVWSGISVHRQWRSHVLGNMLSENELRGKSCEEESII